MNVHSNNVLADDGRLLAWFVKRKLRLVERGARLMVCVCVYGWGIDQVRLETCLRKTHPWSDQLSSLRSVADGTGLR